MIPASLPSNEAERLAALRRNEIVDTLPEQLYDDLARLASQISGTPIPLSPAGRRQAFSAFQPTASVSNWASVAR